MQLLASQGKFEMGVSKGMATSPKKRLAKWFPVVAELLEHEKAASCLETVEILSDVEQVSTLFSSLEDWRNGQILSMDTAFGDL